MYSKKPGQLKRLTEIMKKTIMKQYDKEKVNNDIAESVTRYSKKPNEHATSIINQTARHNTMICLFNNN